MKENRIVTTLRRNKWVQSKNRKMIGIDRLSRLAKYSITIRNFDRVYYKLTKEENEKINKIIRKHSGRIKWINTNRNLPLRVIFRCDNRKMIRKILTNAKLGCKSSQHKIRLPLEMSRDLAYFLGVIAGDGHIKPERKPSAQGGWKVEMWEGNNKYQEKIYLPLVKRLFNIYPNFCIRRRDGKENFFSQINSMIVVRYLTKVLGSEDGYKMNRVQIPKEIYKTNELSCSFISGLFDTDGTVTGKVARHSTVSKKLHSQIKKVFDRIELGYHTHTWLKNKKVQLLYTITIPKRSLEDFDRLVGFKNLKKDKKLKKIIAP